MAVTVITEAQFLTIGFTKVRTEGDVDEYIYLNNYLRYNTVTGKTSVTYGRVQVTYEAIYVSIVDNFAELTTALVTNGVIAAPSSSC
jgi:hypothetical protein